jgi:hypothetical protein
MAVRHEAGWSRIVLMECSLRILPGTPAILTEIFRDFLQPFQGITGIVPTLYNHFFLPSPFQFIYHLTIRRFSVLLFEKVSLNNRRKIFHWPSLKSLLLTIITSSCSHCPYQEERAKPGSLLTNGCSISPHNKLSLTSPMTFPFSYSSAIPTYLSLSSSLLQNVKRPLSRTKTY